MLATWLNLVIQGVLLGGLYAIFALGLSLSVGVMRFVKYEHGAGAVLVEPIAQGRGVLFVAQEGMGDDELRMRGPWVDRVSAFAAAVEKVARNLDDLAGADPSLAGAKAISRAERPKYQRDRNY